MAALAECGRRRIAGPTPEYIRDIITKEKNVNRVCEPTKPLLRCITQREKKNDDDMSSSLDYRGRPKKNLIPGPGGESTKNDDQP